MTRKSPYSWWTRWLRQTLRSRRMSPCTEEQKRTPWDFDVEVYLWHGRNRPCPIWALAPRPTLLWLPMWDISIPFKRLHDRCRHSSAYNCNFLPLYIIPSLKPNCWAEGRSHRWCNMRLTLFYGRSNSTSYTKTYVTIKSHLL